MTELQKAMITYRAQENISQREMARRCKVSSQTINSVENGLQTPTKLTEMKIRMVMENEKSN